MGEIGFDYYRDRSPRERQAESFRGRRNEPAYVIEVARLVAGEWLVSAEDIGRASTADARHLFRLNGTRREHAADG